MHISQCFSFSTVQSLIVPATNLLRQPDWDTESFGKGTGDIKTGIRMENMKNG
ncbi:hypothetical protein DPMN_184424 [Dreissena polymorpha]|uniref:Uncharacterized protein n=1 Tax=Dreissena polymorpha TaxID=45954 RepID=A0A9D4DIH8_DREPO|nr:hypothetical protein DPMN_184424 [Dreissena polymorpha]